MGSGMRTGVQLARISRKSGSQTKGKYRNGGGGVTTQFDTKLIYRRRRMPYRRRRRWKRFVRKVTAVSDKDFAQQSVVRNYSTNNISTGSTTDQQIAGFELYSFNGDPNRDDMEAIQATALTADRENIRFKSAVLDLTCVNTGTTSLEVDLYVMMCRRDVSTAVATTMQQQYVDAFAQQAEIDVGIGGTLLSATQRGVTPFQNTLFLPYWRVLTKRKYMLSAGGTFTYQTRDPKNRYYSFSFDNGIHAKRGWTRGVLLVFKNVPGAGVNGQINVGVTRTYAYIQKELSEKRSGLL